MWMLWAGWFFGCEQSSFVAFQVLSLDGCRQSTSRARAREVVRTVWRAPSDTADGRRGLRLRVSERQPPEVRPRWVISKRKAFTASMRRLNDCREGIAATVQVDIALGGRDHRRPSPLHPQTFVCCGDATLASVAASWWCPATRSAPVGGCDACGEAVVPCAGGLPSGRPD
jgi:hypothetical protein